MTIFKGETGGGEGESVRVRASSYGDSIDKTAIPGSSELDLFRFSSGRGGFHLHQQVTGSDQ